MISAISDINRHIVEAGKNVLLDIKTNAIRRTNDADEVSTMIVLNDMIKYAMQNTINDDIIRLYSNIENGVLRFNKRFY